MSTTGPENETGGRRQRRLSPLVAIGLILLAGAALVGLNVGLATVANIEATLPPTPDIATLPVSLSVDDRNGQLLRAFTTSDGLWRLPVTLEQVDRHFIQMLIAYEDQHFEEHHGVDWLSMLRAAGQYVGAGAHIVSGGSTLTMQLARLL